MFVYNFVTVSAVETKLLTLAYGSIPLIITNSLRSLFQNTGLVNTAGVLP
jgi:hypothetical protein